MRGMRLHSVMIFLSSAAILIAAGQACIGSSFTSQNPRFAQLSLTQDDSKFLTIVFDESKGTGKGYDTLFADVNFNGRFEDAEKYTQRNREDRVPVIHAFFDLQLSTPFNSNADSRNNNIQVIWTKHTDGPKTPAMDSFMAARCISTKSGGKSDILQMVSEFQPSPSLSSAPRVVFAKRASVLVTTRRDSNKTGNTGIGIALKLGDWQVTTISGDYHTRLTVKSVNGKIVHQAKGNMSDFGFG